METDGKHKSKLTVSDCAPTARDWSPGHARQAIKGALCKWAKKFAGEVDVFGLSDAPPGFMAHVVNPESRHAYTFTFVFSHFDGSMMAVRAAVAEYTADGPGVPDSVMGKLSDMVARVPTVGMPDVCPEAARSDSMRPRLKPIRNGNGKVVAFGDPFDNTKGNRHLARGMNGEGGLKIRHAKRGKKPRPAPGADPRGAAYLPLPAGLPKPVKVTKEDIEELTEKAQFMRKG
jgi:hypothetical protein